MISLFPDTLVTGIDKWHIENLMNCNFFWFGHPFEKSIAKGFIFTEKPFLTKIDFTVIVDLEDASHLNPLTFSTSNTIFYSENWNHSASQVASFIKNIIYFNNSKEYFIKKNHVMLCEA
ncbi:MAG TPA: hypothetical protein PKG52_11820 [bacterium]|nr:hypothetical protein [bacterium]HPS29145.1 hypothetical protein [bacterium]